MKTLAVLIALFVPFGVWAEGVTRGPPFVSVEFPASLQNDLISVMVVNRLEEDDTQEVFLAVQRITDDGQSEVIRTPISLEDYLEVESYAIEKGADFPPLTAICHGYGSARINVQSSTFTHDFSVYSQCGEAEFEALQTELANMMLALGDTRD